MMETKKGNDENSLPPVCEACGKQFANSAELSDHLNEMHKKA
jgi:hypothetical protein